MNNLLSYCGLVDVRINASDKDLPVAYEAYEFKIGKSGPSKLSQVVDPCFMTRGVVYL